MHMVSMVFDNPLIEVLNHCLPCSITLINQQIVQEIPKQSDGAVIDCCWTTCQFNAKKSSHTFQDSVCVFTFISTINAL